MLSLLYRFFYWHNIQLHSVFHLQLCLFYFPCVFLKYFISILLSLPVQSNLPRPRFTRIYYGVGFTNFLTISIFTSFSISFLLRKLFFKDPSQLTSTSPFLFIIPRRYLNLFTCASSPLSISKFTFSPFYHGIYFFGVFYFHISSEHTTRDAIWPVRMKDALTESLLKRRTTKMTHKNVTSAHRETYRLLWNPLCFN